MTVKKLKTTMQFITINPNRSFMGHDSKEEAEFIARLNSAIKSLFNTADVGSIIKFNDPSHSFTPQYIKGIQSEFVIEKGENQHRPHVHLILKVTHYSKIKINWWVINTYIAKRIGMEKLHVNAKNVQPGVGAIREYMLKQRPESFSKADFTL